VDTNVLLRLSERNHPQFNLISTAMRRLVMQGAEFCFAPQNLGEFWNASTRPPQQNGFGRSVEETRQLLDSIQRGMTLLAETERVCTVWQRLLVTCEVRGVQVHDAHLAAVLEVHGVTRLLTFNGADFKRFPGLTAIHPRDVQEQSFRFEIEKKGI
jgi:predicted nucleic acid-binding protein